MTELTELRIQSKTTQQNLLLFKIRAFLTRVAIIKERRKITNDTDDMAK